MIFHLNQALLVLEGDAIDNDAWRAGTNWDCPQLNGIFGTFAHIPTSFSVIRFDNRSLYPYVV